MLKCKDLCLTYPDGGKKRTVLNNINLEVEKGENIILTGPSGSGKSSLIYLLSCVKTLTSGSVLFHDMDLTEMKHNSICDLRKKHFAFIFQMHFLIPYLTVLENVLTGINDFSHESKEEAIDLLSKLGLGAHIHKKIHQMSGGERQRTAIARALMNDPDIIFADEPTASLDHNTAVDVLKILKNHKKDCTLIMATHDTSILTGEEKMLRVCDGSVLPTGE